MKWFQSGTSKLRGQLYLPEARSPGNNIRRLIAKQQWYDHLGYCERLGWGGRERGTDCEGQMGRDDEGDGE